MPLALHLRYAPCTTHSTWYKHQKTTSHKQAEQVGMIVIPILQRTKLKLSKQHEPTVNLPHSHPLTLTNTD